MADGLSHLNVTDGELRFSGHRIARLLETLERLSAGQPHASLPISDRHDELDAIAFGINVLADELRWAHARVIEAERARADELREIQTASLRDELAHLSRVATLDLLSGSLAHEISQRLTAMSANAEAALRLVESSPPRLPEVHETLKDMVGDTARASSVLRHVRSLLRKDPTTYVPTELNAVVKEIVQLVAPDAIGRGIVLEVALADDVSTVLADRVQIQQVVLNLLLNAFDAVEGFTNRSGRVLLETSRHDSCALIAVTDNGPGVSDEELAQIFEPFYTTKPDGLGLGLSICSKIVAAHGGVLTTARNPASGMKFIASVPLWPSSAADEGVAQPR
jgi:two-component system, LuxR family, sensor kinase FixL